jgi:POT family proton-dependent oligopeptide transporter
LSAVFVISLAPVLAAVWLALARRGIEPSVTVKFAVGLVFLGAGFLVMAGASARIMGAQKPWPTWLIGTYLLHSIGELCLSPVGLSSVTKLAPRSLLGQMMGIWFVATALGNLVAGLLAGQLASSNPAGMAGQFLRLAAIPVALAALLLLLSGWIARLNPCTGPARSCDPPQV